MKNLIITILIIALCLYSVWAIATISIGTGGSLSVSSGSVSLFYDNGIKWDNGGKTITYDASGDVIQWD